MLLVEQNAALALELADHAYVLETGRVVMSGTSSVVKNDEDVRKSYLGLLRRDMDSFSSRSHPGSPTAPSMPAWRWRW